MTSFSPLVPAFPNTLSAKYPFKYIINIPEVVLQVKYVMDFFLGKIFLDVPVFQQQAP